MRFCRYWHVISLIIVGSLDAIDYSPWIGNIYEPSLRASTWFNSYQSVDAGHKVKRHSACDLFFELDLLVAQSENLEFELKAIAAKTKTHCFGMDSMLFSGKYRWLNDIVGEPVTLTTGLTVSKVFKHALQDIAAFHHGGIQAEGFVSIGKEFSCEQFWLSRLKGVIGFGIGDLGSPWIKGNLAWEYNFWDRHQLSFFANSLWGLGHNCLQIHDFKGYGPIHHQSIDIGALYSFGFEYGIFLRLEYAYRLFARNCPKNVNSVLLCLDYPFSL